MPTNIYQIKPEHVGQGDVMQFLRTAISREYDGKEYYIVNEQTQDRPTPYSLKPRKIVSFGVECAGETEAIHFDITEVTASNSFTWR
jgi:hypothetical protein